MWLSDKVGPWVPTVYAAILSLMVVVPPMFFDWPNNPAFPAFYCFLPMVFFFVSARQREAEKTTTALRARIDALETIARNRGSTAS